MCILQAATTRARCLHIGIFVLVLAYPALNQFPWSRYASKIHFLGRFFKFYIIYCRCCGSHGPISALNCSFQSGFSEQAIHQQHKMIPHCQFFKQLQRMQFQDQVGFISPPKPPEPSLQRGYDIIFKLRKLSFCLSKLCI
uniref:Uncharacterized protein LOC105124605 n=1 Tax=Rhizophora mucronata TaxID=61149 RepID=A0A2P2N2K0_RHIMU